MTDTSNMPRYVSHKTVHALEIATAAQAAPDTDACKLTFVASEGHAPIVVENEVVSRYYPTPGDFYVVYADGYQSISPRKAFLEGYHAENRFVTTDADRPFTVIKQDDSHDKT